MNLVNGTWLYIHIYVYENNLKYILSFSYLSER
jgi:hypothetical protein